MTDATEKPRDVDLSEVAAEPPQESVAREEDVVEGEPGWDAGPTVPEDGAQ